MVVKNMLNMQLMIFLLVIIGFCVRKKGIVGTEGRKNMVDLCLFVTLPFNIIHSFFMEWDWGMMVSCAIVLFLSIGYNVVSIVTSFVCYRKEPHYRQKTLRYGTIVSNGGFLGNPIIEGIYGSSGLFYASIFMIPVRIVMWTIGMSVFMKGSGQEEKAGKRSLFRKVMTNPCIVAVYTGAILMGSGISLPTFLENTISGISSCNTPLSMMLVGMMLAEMNPKGLLTKSVAFYTFVRLIVVPGIVFGLTALLPIDPLLRGITVIIAAMPTPITAVLLSGKHGGDEQCAAGMLFVSTLLSLVTLPIWCMFL
ncbi:AEC family transporter [Coprococcus sp. AM25-15LB]|nr:AEC family transporter [Coprococcus sp. AM25-15LB]RJW09019.1 AEC family transporter [Coprococcus sp. AM25-4LB]